MPKPPPTCELEAVHRRRRPPEHPRNQFLVAVRHLGGAVQLQHVARRVVAAERAAALDRHAGVPAAGQLQFDDMRRRAEHRIGVAVALGEDRGLGVAAGRELARLVGGMQQRRQFLDLDRDQVGGILGHVGVFGEHRGDRIADVAHLVGRQYRLAVGRELFDRAFAEIDRPDVGNVGRGPDRHDARHGARRGGVDGNDLSVRVVGAHHPHVKLAREVDVARERAAAGDQRRVLQPLDRLADPFGGAGFLVHDAACSSALRTIVRATSRR